jgi:hypothetical protein
VQGYVKKNYTPALKFLISMKYKDNLRLVPIAIRQKSQGLFFSSRGKRLSRRVGTTPRIAQVNERAFGVKSHHVNISRVFAKMGWSPQKPYGRIGLITYPEREPDQGAQGTDAFSPAQILPCAPCFAITSTPEVLPSSP